MTKHECSHHGALVDRGANGGILGNDAKPFFTHLEKEFDITGVDNHELNSLKLIDASTKVITQKGTVIIILHQHSYHELDHTIHSAM